MALHGSIIEQVGGSMIGRGTFHHNHPITHLEEFGVVTYFPAVEGLSIKEADKTFFRGLGGQRASCQQPDQSESKAESEPAPKSINELLPHRRLVRREAGVWSCFHNRLKGPAVE